MRAAVHTSASVHSFASMRACEEGVQLSLPALRGGCTGDEWLSLEISISGESGVWSLAVSWRGANLRLSSLLCPSQPCPCLSERPVFESLGVKLDHLAGEEAYLPLEGRVVRTQAVPEGTQAQLSVGFYTRLVAHNSAGTSSAGPRSELLLPHHSISAAVRT